MGELTDVLFAKATDSAPSITDYLFTYDAESATLKKCLIPDILGVLAVLKTLADAKGDLLVASGDNIIGRLALGSDGQILYVDTAQTLGVKWAAPPSGSGIVAGIMDAKGDLIVATGNDTPARFGVGSDGQILTADSTQTPGVRWGNRQGQVSSITSGATPTADAADAQFNVTAAAANMTIAAPTGSPTDGQGLLYRFKDNGVARSIAWNAIFRAIGITLPTATVISKTMYVGFRYNSADTKWDGVATGVEA